MCVFTYLVLYMHYTHIVIIAHIVIIYITVYTCFPTLSGRVNSNQRILYDFMFNYIALVRFSRSPEFYFVALWRKKCFIPVSITFVFGMLAVPVAVYHYYIVFILHDMKSNGK